MVHSYLHDRRVTTRGSYNKNINHVYTLKGDTKIKLTELEINKSN